MRRYGMKKRFLSVILSVFLGALFNMSVFAAEPGEIENIYIPGEVSNEYVTAEATNPLARASSVTHRSTVKSSYGLAVNCSLDGTCYCLLSNAKVSASYSAVSTYYRNNGGKLINAARSGASTADSDFTWSDGDYGNVRVDSTTTVTTCSKSGYQTVTLTNNTTNPY